MKKTFAGGKRTNQTQVRMSDSVIIRTHQGWFASSYLDSRKCCGLKDLNFTRPILALSSPGRSVESGHSLRPPYSPCNASSQHAAVAKDPRQYQTEQTSCSNREWKFISCHIVMCHNALNGEQSELARNKISPALQPNSKRTICDWQRLGPAAWISDRVLPTWFPESINRPHIRAGVLKISRGTDNVKSSCTHRQSTRKRTCANLLTIVPTVIAAQ